MSLSLRGSYVYAINAAVKTISSVPVVAGDLIIVAYRDDGPALTTTTCADNASGGTNTYNEVGTGAATSNATTEAHVFYAIAKATATLSITVTNTIIATVYATIIVHVVRGAHPTLASVLDTYAFGANEAAAAVAHVGPYITTTNANDYLFAFWHTDQANSIDLIDNGTGAVMTKRQTYTNWSVGGPSQSFDKIVSATGTYRSETSEPSSGVSFEGSVIVAFKEGTPTIDSFTSDISSVASGGAVVLSWTAGGATSYSIDNGVGACTSPTTVHPTVNTTYTLSATNSVGDSTAQVLIKIIATAFQANAFQNDSFQIYSGVVYDATRMMMIF